MSTTERLRRLGLSQLENDPAKLADALKEQSARYEKSLREWHETREAAKKKKSVKAPSAPANAPSEPTTRSAVEAPSTFEVPSAVSESARSLLAPDAAEALIAGYAASPPGSPARAALDACLLELAQKELTTQQAIDRIEALEAARSRPVLGRTPAGPRLQPKK